MFENVTHKFRRIYDGKILIWPGESPQELRPTVENVSIPNELLELAYDWYQKSKATGDIGSCVVGAAMEFEYQGVKYEMKPQSPWQGEGSWTIHTNYVIDKLMELGATQIYWECGMLD